MTIKSYKQAVCNSCGCGIDAYPYPISSKALNQIIEELGGIVKGRKHYCDKRCFETSQKQRETRG